MLRFLCVAFCCLLPSLSGAADRVALVLGQERYEHLRPLGNPVNDAVAIEARLRELGFEVYLETNRDKRRMRRALEDFSEDANGAELALVFFAGHGMEVAGRNYLMPLDVQAENPEALISQSIALDEVVRLLGDVARSGVLIVDACRTDPFGGAEGGQDGRGGVALRKPVAVSPGLARLGRADGLLYAFAAAPGQAALDGTGQNSPFTEALLRHLASPGLEIRSVFSLVQQDVYERTRALQLPYVESGLPRMIFAAGTGDLPERDQLLLHMADLDAEDRIAVERIAAQMDMPLAPLYGALISAGLAEQSFEVRDRELTRAAEAFVALRTEMRSLRVADPRVADLRQEAEAQMSLGAFETARGLIAQAAGVDRMARETLKDNLVARTLSEAESMRLSAQMSDSALKRDLAIADYRAAMTLFEDALTLTGAVQHGHLLSADKLGQVFEISGNLAATTDAYQTLNALADRRLATDPGNTKWQRDLSVSHDRLGDIAVKNGDLSAARRAYQASLEISQALSARDLSNTEWQRDLSISHNKLGDIAVKDGDLPAARRAYQASLEIREALTARDSGNTEWQRDLSVSHERMGNVAVKNGDLSTARRAYQAGLEIREALAARDPGNTEWQRDLSVSHNKLGDIAVKNGDLSAARRAYQASLEIREALSARDPGNTQWQRDLSVSHDKLGNVAVKDGDLSAARRAYQASLEIAEALAARDPGNTEWQRDLSVSHNKLGDIAVKNGDLSAARRAYQASLEIREALSARDPGNTQWQWDLLYSYYKISTVSDAPLPALQKALTIGQTLESADRLTEAQKEGVAFLKSRIDKITNQ